MVMISIMMNLKEHEKNCGNTSINIFVLLDLRREIREDTVFVMKAKIHFECSPGTKHF